MISEVVMPQMGADMVEGTIVRWLKHEGDPVDRGEVIAEIETDKANVEIEAFEGGTFRKTLATEGDVISVGAVIALIAAPDDDITGYAPGSVPRPSLPATAFVEAPIPQGASSEAATPPKAPASGRIHVSPVARSLAEERNIDLRAVQGTGPGGRIIRRDIEAAIQAGPVAKAVAAVAPVPALPVQQNKMRKAIARRMSQSKREAPHYYLLLDIDMTDALVLRRQFNATLPDGEHTSINDLIVRAAALALQRHPQFNATIAGEDVTIQPAQHVCIAIALDDGLIAPAILDAGNKTLVRIAADSKDLAARAKGGSLRPEELTGGTFTITNLGAYGVETLIGIIQPPQTAILGTGAVSPQPAVRDAAIVVREMMKVALSADHRVTDGAQGALFIGEIKRLLEQPLLLVL
jgi:pyruvate dehydrogenase E2 component (dihydrolipoamide acetyltransferase)